MHTEYLNDYKLYKFKTSKNKFGVGKLGTKDKLIIAFVILELLRYVSQFQSCQVYFHVCNPRISIYRVNARAR